MIEFGDIELFDEDKSLVSVCNKCHEISGRLFSKCPLCGEPTTKKKVHYTDYNYKGIENGLPLMEISSRYLISYGPGKDIASQLIHSDIATVVTGFRKVIEPNWKSYTSILFTRLNKIYKKEDNKDER